MRWSAIVLVVGVALAGVAALWFARPAGEPGGGVDVVARDDPTPTPRGPVLVRERPGVPAVEASRTLVLSFEPACRLQVPATVVLERGTWRAERACTGETILLDVPVGEVEVTISGPRVLETRTRLEIPGGTAPVRRAVPLDPLNKMSGRVIDASTGDPLPAFEAGVTTRCTVGGVPLLHDVVSVRVEGADGRFCFGAVRAPGCVGEARAWVRADGYEQATGSWHALGRPVISDEVVALERVLEVVGLVVDETTRQPVGGARVQLVDGDLDARALIFQDGVPRLGFTPRGEAVTTTARGRFALDASEPRGARLLVTADGYRPATSDPLDRDDAGTPIEVVLVPGATIEVHVSGVVFDDVVAQVMSRGHEGLGTGRRRLLDETGTVVFSGLDPGTYDVSARLEREDVQARLGGRVITLGPRERRRVALELGQGARLVGRLTLPPAVEDLPLVVAVVFDGRVPGVTTTTRGPEFEVEGVLEGDHVLMIRGRSPNDGPSLCALAPVSVAGSGVHTVELDLRGRGVRLELADTGTTRLVITRARTGDERIDAILEAERFYATPDGVCEVHGLPPGDYVVGWARADETRVTATFRVAPSVPGHVEIHRLTGS